MPLPPPGNPDMILGGCWEVYNDEVHWVWTHKSGWREVVDVVKVVQDSTPTQGTSKDFTVAEAVEKVLAVYRALDLTEPSSIELRRKMVAWFDQKEVPQLHVCEIGLRGDNK